MTINIERKHIIVAVVVIVFIVLIIVGVGVIRNTTYFRQAKNCQRDIHNLYFVSSLAASGLHDAWYDYIFEDKEYIDRATGKFYESRWSMPSGADIHYCSDFNRAIMEKSDFYEKQGIDDIMDSLYTSVKLLMTKMTPAPPKYSEIQSDITALFHTAEAMYNCASSPKGSLKSYTEMINSLSADYEKQKSQVDIEIGEIDPMGVIDFEIDVLHKLI